MLEDRIALLLQLLRAQWHAHLDVLDLPLCPCATVHPYTAVLEPFCTALLLKVECCKDCIGTYAVCSVRVGKVTCNEDLVWLDRLEQLTHDLHISLAQWALLDLACLIEWQVEEVNMVERYLIVGRSCASLTATDKSLDGQDIL